MKQAAGNAFGRRRFMAIAGAVGGLSLLPTAARAATELHHWSGVALGARASIRLLHPDRAEARRIIDLAVQEIERLETIFSLYRSDSAVARLNRDGRLEDPPLELVELLSRAREVSRLSGGAFDVTVQPLWQRYREHFEERAEDTPPVVADVLPLVDWRALRVASEGISFARSGMAITLNGIAQGFVTDRVADLLRRNGVGRVLLDLGEARATGTRGDGLPWRIGIADPRDPTRSVHRLDCVDLAVATSGGYGTVFDRGHRYSHLIDPRDGHTAPVLRGTTVTAHDATTADAWSTAFTLMTRQEIVEIAPRLGRVSVYLATADSVKQVA